MMAREAGQKKHLINQQIEGTLDQHHQVYQETGSTNKAYPVTEKT